MPQPSLAHRRSRFPVGFANIAISSEMADDGTMGTLLHKLYLMPGRSATARRADFHAIEDGEQNGRRTLAVAGSTLRESRRSAVLRTPGDAAASETRLFHSAS